MGKLIKQVKGREIIDSRGFPTVEAEVTLENGICARAAVPSGASTGTYEAVELRDGGSRFNGKGVMNAVGNINGGINKLLTGLDSENIRAVDNAMINADGTENKSKLGANAILAVSMANARAAAASYNMPLYRFLGGIYADRLPVPMSNIINGGAHSKNTLDIQEFMIVPIGAKGAAEGIRWCCEVYAVLKEVLKTKGLSTAVGDEGGFAPDVADENEAIELILESFRKAGYSYGKYGQFMISLDIAASEWKSGTEGIYHLPKKNINFTTSELIEKWRKLAADYPIYSIEDPLDEEDFDGWQIITAEMGTDTVLVGDDLFVTNKKRLLKGINMKAGNAILIKPNQIGTVSETIDTIKMAKRNNYRTIMSHRSGETEDTTIADLAVGLGTGFIKTGAPCRSERTAKYNRLIRIEENL